MLNDQVFTTKEAAQYLKINSQVMERYLRQGELPARKVGRKWRISRLALDLWLAPTLASLLPRISIWQGVFSIGDKIGRQIEFNDEEILKSVRKLRKERGILIKSSS